LTGGKDIGDCEDASFAKGRDEENDENRGGQRPALVERKEVIEEM